jgi:hypothetical protein
LNVKPPVPLKIKDSAISLVCLPVAVRPNTRLLKSNQRVHASPRKMRLILALKKIFHSQDCFVHVFVELHWRFEGALGLISITCSWSSFPNVKLDCSTKFTTRPWKFLMILSTMGWAFSRFSTIEYSCSGLKTSRVMYVTFPLKLSVFIND